MLTAFSAPYMLTIPLPKIMTTVRRLRRSARMIGQNLKKEIWAEGVNMRATLSMTMIFPLADEIKAK